MIKIRGMYSQPNGRHEIMFYIQGRTFTIGAPTLDQLIKLCEAFWSPRSDLTVTQYNRASQGLSEDTQVIEIEKAG
jgi:hypothetical protein